MKPSHRLPLVLLACLVIMVGWSYLFPPRHPPAPTAASAAPAATSSAAKTTDASVTGAAAAAPPAAAPADVLGTRIVDDQERELALTFGAPGAPGYYRALFTNRGAGLKELRTGRFFDRARLTPEERAKPEHWTQLLVPVESGAGTTASMLVRSSPSSQSLEREPLDSALWTMRPLGPSEQPDGVEFTLAPGSGVTFVKRIRSVAGEDRLRLEFEIKNDALTAAAGQKMFVLTPAACVPAESGDKWYAEPQVIAAARPHGNEVLQHAVMAKNEGATDLGGSFAFKQALSYGDPLAFAGAYNKYFAVLAHAADDTTRPTLTGASWRRVRDEAWVRAHPADAQRPWHQIVADVQFEVALPEVGQSRVYSYDVYAGPKDRARLEHANPDYSAVVESDLGMFSAIASVLLVVLNFFHWVASNWGVAIILLTLSVRLLLFPINRRSQTAMARYQAKMKRLQPRIEELKKKHAGDAGKLRNEQTKLMQEEGAFPPLGGCLPMFLQIPVFIGLYRALGVSFDLRQAPFMGWIHDLALPDRLVRLDFNTHLPFIGTIEYLNILPILMVGLMILQQRGQPAPADEQAARMQKMMMWMPVMFCFILYNYAAGLSLYMITGSILGIIEQRIIKKYWPVDDTELPKKKNGFMARLMEAQQKQMKKLDTPGRPQARKARR